MEGKEKAKNVTEEEKLAVDTELAATNPDIVADETPRHTGESASRSKAGIIVLILILILAIAGVVALIIWKPFGAKDKEISRNEASMKISEVSVNDPAVQYLYGNFKALSGHWETLIEQAERFYFDENVRKGEVDDLLMLDLALYAAGQRLGTSREWSCTMRKDDQKILERYAWYRERLTATDSYYQSWSDRDWLDKSLYWLYENGCFEMSPVRTMAKDMFGKDLVFNDNTYIPYYRYSSEYDELYAAHSGRGGVYPRHERFLEKAEKDESHYYLYETVAINAVGAVYKLDEVKLTERGPDFGTPVFVQNHDGTTTIGTTVEEYFETHLDEFTHFKWTFKKTPEGNYIFAGLEEVDKI